MVVPPAPPTQPAPAEAASASSLWSGPIPVAAPVDTALEADDDYDDATIMSPVDDDATVLSARHRAARWLLVTADGATHELPAQGSVEIGRASRGRGETHGHLFIADPTRTMSKSHVRLRRDGDDWFVTDLDSTNGTAKRASEGARTVLTPGEEVAVDGVLELGDLEVRVRRADEEG